MDGIINLYKPAGITSNDAVLHLRRYLKTVKVGHAGTLDPDAAGVLPICLGKATRIAQYIAEGEKVYIAELTLGAVTDTQDASGHIIEQRPINSDINDIYQAIYSFKGKQQQVPPMYSAIKYNGVPLYKLARIGKEVIRIPRDIEVYDIVILYMEPPNKVLFKVWCSKGTYIRTLCHDIGQRLGCGGYMSFLLRTRVAGLHITESVTLEDIYMLEAKEQLHNILIPIDKVLDKYQAVYVTQNGYERAKNGSNLYKVHVEYFPEGLEDGNMVKIYNNKKFIALGQINLRNGSKFIKLIRVFI